MMANLRKIEFEDFTPDGVSIWAVWDGWCFKTYANRGPALNKFSGGGRAKLYEQVPGTGWVERAVKDGKRPCDMCGATDLGYSGYYERPWVWKRGDNGKITSPPELLCLCLSCRTAAGL